MGVNAQVLIDNAIALDMYDGYKDTRCGHKIHKIKESATDIMYVIPDDVVLCDGILEGVHFSHKNVKVVGGKNVARMLNMFSYSSFQSLDLSKMDTAKTKDMAYLFKHSTIGKLKLNSFNTSKVWNMEAMFVGVNTGKLDLSSFDTSKAMFLTSMFTECKAKEINLSSFKINDNAEIDFMFDYCDAKIITNDKRLLDAYKNRALPFK